MRKAVLVVLLLSAIPLLAQDDEDWRRRAAPQDRYTPSPHAFEVTPFVGWRWGGTIYADQTLVFDEDLDAEPSASFGVNVGIPIGHTGLKLELMANRQSTELESAAGLFLPDQEIADMDVTYYHAGLQIPFLVSPHAVPYSVFSMGLANLDPQVNGLTSEQVFSGSLGLGVKVPVSRVISFRFEGRGYWAFLDDSGYDGCGSCDYYYYYDGGFYQGEVNAGLVFSF